ncbi:bacterioferritin [Pseudoxanthomonas sp. GM95]|uniref:bacterioferritin n=1 Tax=Pseudoxanthomonas sp. GM95 TaxID=1881043 RepID=UPI0008B86916|nr:bacterioferritin [Pseudoxanthomonas sp. GM95]SEL48466.1 bacterioferritin [Pseudoxanthomonas sp. GM95]
MKGDAKVIEFLNKVLFDQLTAINQYFLHAKMLKNWGLMELSEHSYKASIVEMKQADKLADRILFLEGLPNFQALGKLRIGENPREMFECDLALAGTQAVPVLRDAVAYCETVSDYVSRQLLVDILDKEEEWIDWLDTQLDLIGRIGEPNYLLTKLDD